MTRGHVWRGLSLDPARPYATSSVVMHLAGTHPDDRAEPLPPVEAHLCECRECGLVLARADHPEGYSTRAYGLDLESLAVMGSAPACRPLVMGGPS